MEQDIFSYEVTNDSLTMKDMRNNIIIQANFPNEYSEKYNFTRIILAVSSIKANKKAENNNGNNNKIKRIFLSVLRNLPGKINDYTKISVICSAGEITISNGKLKNYVNNQTKEIITASSCIIDLGDEDYSILDYDYSFEYGKDDIIHIGDTITRPYLKHPTNKEISKEVLKAYSMYVQAFINHLNADIDNCNKSSKDNKSNLNESKTKKRKI